MRVPSALGGGVVSGGGLGSPGSRGGGSVEIVPEHETP